MSENTAQTTRQLLCTPGKGHTTILTSFRRNGMGVGSPVGTVASQGNLYFMTPASTGKVKRLANNPRVTVAPGTFKGEALGPAIEGTARRLSGEELKQARDLNFSFGQLPPSWFWKSKMGEVFSDHWRYTVSTCKMQTERVEQRFCDLVNERSLHMPELQTLLTGLAIGESPRWHEDRLWFSNWGTQEVVAVDLEGKSEVIVRVPTTIPISIDWLPDGRLLVVSGREGLLLCREPDGELITHADLTSLSDHPWNEIVVDGRGNAYINNISFDFPGGDFAPGIIALVTPDGSARQVADGIAFPNGMVVTPDNSTLIVAESYGQRLTAFDIAADGSLSNRRVWAALSGGAPDGICLDAENAVWYADVPNKRCVRVREGGEVLQTIDLDRGCFACMLGGVDNRTLFMMAAEWGGPANMADQARTGQVLTIEALAPGVNWP